MFRVHSPGHTAVKNGLLENWERKLPSPVDWAAVWTASFLCCRITSPDEGGPAVLDGPFGSIPACQLRKKRCLPVVEQPFFRSSLSI